MKILMIGGTGIISTAVTEQLVEQGNDVWLLCRNSKAHSAFANKGAKLQTGDINDEPAVRAFLEDQYFDVVVDWTIMKPEQAQRDIRLFTGKTAHYIFISTACTYERPSKNYLITEDTAQVNPFSDYATNKIACEKLMLEAFRKDGFPVTIVRPSLTFGDFTIPYVLVSWNKTWSLIDRIKQGKRVIVPGDGTSLWVITHNSDFAKGIIGLMGNKEAFGEAFHITSDEVLTWDDVIRQIGEVIGIEPKTVHISSEFITAFMPEQLGNLIGDKVTSVVFDNSKLKKFVPGFKATTTFRQGVAQTIHYMEQHPELQGVDTEYEDALDRIIAGYDAGLSLAGKH